MTIWQAEHVATRWGVCWNEPHAHVSIVPDTYGNIHFSVCRDGMCVDLQEIRAIASRLKETLPARTFGAHLSAERAAYCENLAEALNAAGVRPRQRGAA